MLWKITRDGRQSWLYGTVHAGRADWTQPGPVVAQALGGSKVLALELDPLSPTLQAEMAGWMAPPPEPLPPALADRLVRQLRDACLPESLATRLHPMAGVTLAQLALAQRVGLHAEFGIDAALARRARQAGQPIVSMETPDAQMRALFGPRGTVNLPEVDAMLMSLERGTDRVSLERLAGDWERGDHADLSRYADWCDCLTTDAERALMKRVLDDRNGALARSVQHLHQAQGPVFAAVGALHMTGPASLLILLAAQGFELERVQWPSP